MKISEIIKLLETELEERGDVKVVLCACYGETSETFEIMRDDHMYPEDKGKLGIWTNIMTG